MHLCALLSFLSGVISSILSVAYFLCRLSGTRYRLGEAEGRLSELSRTRDRLGEAEGRLSELSRTRDW